MKNKTTPTVRQALKMALKDVGGWLLYGLLFVAGAGLILGMCLAGSTLLARYYPAHAQVMATLTCMMVPGLIVISTTLTRARYILGDDVPGRRQRYLDAVILLVLLAQIATTLALSWMIYHPALISPGFMLPVMVVCAFAMAVSVVIRVVLARAGG